MKFLKNISEAPQKNDVKDTHIVHGVSFHRQIYVYQNVLNIIGMITN